MKWNDLWLRLRALARHRRAESELDEELRFHMEMEARKVEAFLILRDEMEREEKDGKTSQH